MLVASALLLGSLIILQNQKSEPEGNIAAHKLTTPSELAAELPIQQTGQRPDQALRNHSCFFDQICPGDLSNASHPHAASCQMRMKTQMNIYLDQKPVLEFRSGQYLCHPSNYGDPPGFIS
jgi:hypothetical protein